MSVAPYHLQWIPQVEGLRCGEDDNSEVLVSQDQKVQRSAGKRNDETCWRSLFCSTV